MGLGLLGLDPCWLLQLTQQLGYQGLHIWSCPLALQLGRCQELGCCGQVGGMLQQGRCTCHAAHACQVPA